MKDRLIQFLAQGFGSGRAPVAPGTVGSLAGLLWFGLLLQTGSLWGFLLGSLAAVAVSVWICGEAERVLKQKDPGSIVLDEIVAVPLCFLSWIGGEMIRGGQFPGPEAFYSGSRVWGLVGVFVLFRVFDVAKPWPARQSQNLPGGWGVTLDDVAAAAWVNVVMGFVVLGVIQGSTPEDSTRAGSVQQGLSEEEVVQGFLALEQERRGWDSTVWAADLIAGRHEDVFIRFWDDLRRSGHAAEVFAGFSAGRIAIPQPSVQTTGEWGIVTTRFGTNASELEPPKWRRWVLARAAEGFEVEQSEWRQVRFEPAGSAEEGARSVFNIRLHARRPGSNERFMLTGPLRVHWAPQTRPQAPPVPHRIDPGGLTLLRRAGDPVFQETEAWEIQPRRDNPFIDPLIVRDLDGDGLPEIILAGRNLVYWNRRGGFEAASLCAHDPGVVYAAVMADFDGDGEADILFAGREGLLLFSGAGDGQFQDPPRRIRVSAEPLLNPMVLTAGDIDGDGDLDVWLGQYKLPYFAGQMPTPYHDANDGFPSFLLLNDGKGGFTDGTMQAGLAGKRHRRVYSGSFIDFDDDGDLDLIVVSDFAGLDLYENDGRGRFTDVTDSFVEERRAFGMAHTFGDYNLDGRLDFLMVGMNSPTGQRLDGMGLGPEGFTDWQRHRGAMAYGNRLYLGTNGGFRQAPFNDQIAETGWSWGATTFDFDNDGDEDIYMVNGHRSAASARDYETQFWRHDIYVGTSERDPVRDLYFKATGRKLYGAGMSYGGYEKNRLLINRSGEGFVEAGYLMGVSMEADSRNVVAADVDADGRLDLVVTTFEEWPALRQTLRVFRNRAEPVGNWIGLSLRGAGPGRMVIGAKVALRTPTGTRVRHLVTGDSHRAQHPDQVHFGLGSEERVEALEIRWPDGGVETLRNPERGRYHRLEP